MTTPTGIISKPISILEEMLASSVSFQNWVGAIDATSAKLRIHQFSYSGGIFPNVLLTETRAASNVPIATDTWVADGVLSMMFQAEIDPMDLNQYGDVVNLEEVFVKLRNVIGAILDDLITLANTGGNLLIKEPGIQEVDGGTKLDDHDVHDSNAKRVVWMEYEVHWGG